LRAFPSSLEPVTIADEDLGSGIAARYAEHASDDPDVPLRLLPLPPRSFSAAKSTLAGALSLMGNTDAGLLDEMRALVRQVVFAEGDTEAPPFGGATTFYLWGAIFINASLHPDPLTMATGLVHEAAHLLLLGSTMGKPLVENDPSERYASPLRADPRPMDGVVHACFVLARMHYLTRRIARSATDLDRGELDRLLDAYQQDFRIGDELIAKQARFTEVGRSVYLPARAYMQSC
jgi:HEXXH motif-containing protein